jgi:hypothetical protein
VGIEAEAFLTGIEGTMLISWSTMSVVRICHNLKMKYSFTRNLTILVQFFENRSVHLHIGLISTNFPPNLVEIIPADLPGKCQGLRKAAL